MTLTHLLIAIFSIDSLLFIFARLVRGLPFGLSVRASFVIATPLALVCGLELAWWICRLLGFPPLGMLFGPCPSCGRRPAGWSFRWESRLLLTLACGSCEQSATLDG